MTVEEELDQRALLTRLELLSTEIARVVAELPYSGGTEFKTAPLWPGGETTEERFQRIAHNLAAIRRAYNADAPYRERIAADQARYRALRGAVRDLLKD